MIPPGDSTGMSKNIEVWNWQFHKNDDKNGDVIMLLTEQQMFRRHLGFCEIFERSVAHLIKILGRNETVLGIAGSYILNRQMWILLDVWILM